jgi:hypothetical protein
MFWNIHWCLTVIRQSATRGILILRVLLPETLFGPRKKLLSFSKKVERDRTMLLLLQHVGWSS